MARRTIVGVVVLCAGVVTGAQQPPPVPLDEKQFVGFIGGFEKRHQVDVPAADERMIADAINQSWATLATPSALPPQQTMEQYQQFLAGAIVRGYLSQHRVAAGQGRAAVTGLSAVSFRDYIVRLQKAGADRPKGELVARSTPSEAPVTVDGTRDGETESTYVMSPGQHTVVISPSGRNACTFQVLIEAGKTQTVTC